MTKLEFILTLKDKLSGLPQDEVNDRLVFYGEMIDDRIEEGLSEEDAVREMGSIDALVSQILSDTPLIKMVKNKVRPKRKMRAFEIVLLALGSPIWVSLLAAAIVVILAIYVVIWSVVASVWIVFAALAASSACLLAGGILLLCQSSVYTGIALLGVSPVLAGLSIFAFFGCIKATLGMVWITKKLALAIKRLFIRKKEDE